jgi:MFS family permease
MFSAAGDIAKDSYSATVAPSQAIAMVSGIAYFGFLVGPPFIGWIAEITSLRKAMFVPALLTILLAITVQRVIPSGKRS